MRKNQKHNRQYLKDKRRALRKKLTPAEARLWTFLKNRQLKGRKFTKQHSIENFIVDFYCSSEKMIIELDGQGHFELGQALSDEDRDKRLSESGFLTLRFENKLVFDNIDYVLKTIEDNFRNNLPGSTLGPAPS